MMCGTPLRHHQSHFRSLRPNRIGTTMTTHPYLFKRGDVYQWRRKTRRFSTKIVDIKLSLGTTDRLDQPHLSCPI
jgi:hypothetical protein